MKRLGLEVNEPDMSGWEKMVNVLMHPEKTVSIGIVGKYVDLKESYKSLNEAIVHGGIANSTRVDLVWIDSETLESSNVEEALADVDGILVPGGFGERGAEGKICAIRYAREAKKPFFGICFGMQLAAIEFARDVCGIKDATSREFEKGRKGSRNFVIDVMEEQKTVKDKGGTMRLGSFSCALKAGTLTREIYDSPLIHERHRHRFEFNNKYRPLFEKRGMTLSGICEERDLVEIIELADHPWFIGVQFHPEFKSRPTKPHPLFQSFVEATLAANKQTQAAARKTAKAPSKKLQSAAARKPATTKGKYERH
jgi:CTP synthase